MRTLVVSDLHLGSPDAVDVLRRPEPRAALVAALEGIDRLVLLGDTLEGRGRSQREVLERALPVLAELGAAMAGGEVVIVPGNHDHELAARWLEHGPDLRLDERRDPSLASPAAMNLAAALAPARVEVAYPGVWLRDDVYATHGHYLDVHTPVPILERLGAGAMARLAGAPPTTGATPADYERLLAPIYAWAHAAAERTEAGTPTPGSSRSHRVWQTLTVRRGIPLRRWTLATALRVAVVGVNRAGLGPVRAEFSAAALRRGGLEAMGEVLRRLGVDAPHVLFGHTHRAGPVPGDDPGAWGPLMNTGSWVLQDHFTRHGPGHERGCYAAGGAIEVGDTGPPVLRWLLDDVESAALRAPIPA